MHDIRGLTRGINGITGARLRRPIIASLLAIGLTTALSASAVARTAASASSQPAYLNASVPVQARVSNLLGRMTLPEKIGQMVQIEATQVTD
jgi:beta-glucosidase